MGKLLSGLLRAVEIYFLRKWFVTVFNFQVNKGATGAGDGWVALDDSGSFQEHVSVATGWHCVQMIINSNHYQQVPSQINLPVAETHKGAGCNHR